jgi:hypothetical protein
MKKDKQYNGQMKKTNNTMAKWKRQTIQWPNEKTTIYKTLHRKLKIDQHESL